MNSNSFFIRQFTQIRLEGWSAVWRKLKTSNRIFLGLILGIPVISIVLLVRIIRPLIWIKFGPLRSDVIGNSVLNLEYYLSERELKKSKTFDFFYFSSPPANEQWALMARRELRVHFVVQYFDWFNQILPLGHVHRVRTNPEGMSSKHMQYKILLTEDSHLRFTEEENIRGGQFLQELGLQTGDRFVCLIVRDPAYKAKCQNQGGCDWSYHNYRDSDIDTYDQAALALAEKGYWVFRMGKGEHKPFVAQHPRILDYVNMRYRDDFLDIWLTANCHFMISSGTGLDSVAFVFRRPTVSVNFIPLGFFNSQWKVIIVPKHLSFKSNGDSLTLKEYLKHNYLHSEEYEKAGIVIQNLTAMEIQEAVLEMESRLSGTWEDTFGDIELQNRFREQFQEWDQFRQQHPERISHESRIGAHFLRHHTEWLCQKTGTIK